MNTKQQQAIFDWFADQLVRTANQLNALQQHDAKTAQPATRRAQKFTRDILQQMHDLDARRTTHWVAEQATLIRDCYNQITTTNNTTPRRKSKRTQRDLLDETPAKPAPPTPPPAQPAVTSVDVTTPTTPPTSATPVTRDLTVNSVPQPTSDANDSSK